MTLLLDGATLLASPNVSDWRLVAPLPSYGAGRDAIGTGSLLRFDSFLWVWNATGFRLTSNSSSNGQLVGSGEPWWALKDRAKLPATPGHLIEVLWSTDVEIDHVRLSQSPFWTVHVWACDRVHVHDAGIFATPTENAPNTDGLDIDSSSNVLVERMHIATGDDGVAIKSGWDLPGQLFNMPATNITVRNSNLTAIKGACVAVGSEMSGGVRNVTVAGNTCNSPSRYAFGVKTGPGRGGYVAGVRFLNNTVTGGLFNNSVTWITAVWSDHNPAGCNKSALPAIADIVFDGLTVVPGTGAVDAPAASLEGSVQLPATGIVYRNVNLPGARAWQCNDGVHGTATNVQPPACPQLGY